MSAPNLPRNWQKRLDRERQQAIRAHSDLAELVERSWKDPARVARAIRLANAGVASLTMSHTEDGRRLATFSRLARVRRGLTQAQLGEQLGITGRTLLKVEVGEKAIGDGALSQAWAEACHVPLGAVLLDFPPEP
jgi:hypothetical protein